LITWNLHWYRVIRY